MKQKGKMKEEVRGINKAIRSYNIGALCWGTMLGHCLIAIIIMAHPLRIN